MKENIELSAINAQNVKFHHKVQQDLLTRFKLDPVMRLRIAEMDLNHKCFSADLFCEYFLALATRKTYLENNVLNPTLDISKTIEIKTVDPKASFADSYMQKNPVMNDKDMQFNLLDPDEICITKQNLSLALDILSANQESGLQSNLLHSMAIYGGTGTIPTSASSICCQGQIYIKNVGNDFPLFYYLDMLVHEVAHQHFNILNNLYYLIADYNQTFLSVTKTAERPIYGIMHSIFVLYRLIIFYNHSEEILKSSEQPYSGSDYEKYLRARFFKIPCNYAFRLEVYHLKLATILQQLRAKDACLTDSGKELIKIITEIL